MLGGGRGGPRRTIPAAVEEGTHPAHAPGGDDETFLKLVLPCLFHGPRDQALPHQGIKVLKDLVEEAVPVPCLVFEGLVTNASR